MWDRISSDIVRELLEEYLIEQKCFLPHITYGEYVNKRGNAYKHLHLRSEQEHILSSIKAYKENVISNKTTSKMLQINLNKEKEVVYDIKWLMSKFNEITACGTNISEIPFVTLYHGRNDNSLKTLGMYIDYVPGVYNVNDETISYHSDVCNKLQKDSQEYTFLCEDYMLDINHDLLVVNMYDAVDYENFYTVNELKLNECEGCKEGIECVVYSKMISLLIAFVSKGESDEEVIARIKKAFSIEDEQKEEE